MGGQVAELLGQHRYQLDAKGRIALPAKFREAFPSGAWLTLGQDGAIYAFPEEEWRALTRDVPKSPLVPQGGRDFARMVFGNAEHVDLDGQGRLVVPVKLRERIRLDREAVVLGVYNRLEIWAAAEWDRYEPNRVGAYVEGTMTPAASE